MKIAMAFAIVVFVVLSAFGCDDSSNWEQEQLELAQRFTTAFGNKDVDGVMDCFWNSPDAVLVLDNGIVVRGWDNIRAGVKGMVDAHAELSLVVNEASRFRLGENVITVGEATWTRTLKDEFGGGTTTLVEVWTDVSREVDGKWVYVLDHAHDLTPFTQKP